MATNIKLERENKNLSQSQLGEIMNVSKQTICDWEKGRHVPPYNKLKQLSNYFKKPIDFLLQQEANEQPDSNQAEKNTL